MHTESITEQTIAGSLMKLKPNPASYLSVTRELETYPGNGLRPVRVSILSSFTAEVLYPYIVAEGARRGMRILLHFCPFNQVETQTLNPRSELYNSEPELIVVALRLEDVASNLCWRYTQMSAAELESELNKIKIRFQDLLAQIREHSNATILVFNFGPPELLDAGIADAGLNSSQSLTIARANEVLAEVCRTQTAAYVFDYHRLVTEFGLTNWCDTRLLYSASIPFGMNAQIALGQRIARYVRAIGHPPCKCLVVDLDNTLWGGVLGEEGLGGIQLSEQYPGNVYKSFQRRLLALRDQGVLLAIASKNNEADVIDVMERHPDMLLKMSDFASTQIHWEDKATSLKAIAADLNIGLDSIVYFDDTPHEREWVRQSLPEVTVVDVPSTPLGFLDALEGSGAFDRLTISAEDRQRAEMVQKSRERDKLRTQTKSIDDFLRGLNMVATVGDFGPATSSRIVQLLAKTNQFNLTTRRYTAAQLDAIQKNRGIILWARIKDEFGDNGLVGVGIVIPEDPKRWRIDSLLLSCRVIGRRVETLLLALLAERVSNEGGQLLVGEYIPTSKNGQVADLYAAHGFQAEDEARHYWRFDVKTSRIARPDVFEIQYETETNA